MSNNGRQLLVTSALSSVAVAATAATCGTLEGQSAWRPINAISHIFWGPHAALRNRWTIRYTGSGLLLNAVACGFWAWLHQQRRRKNPASNSLAASVRNGIAVSALAYVTDYYLVPPRFTPGFELTLPSRSFPWIYGALAIGLVVPEVMSRRSQRRTG